MDAVGISVHTHYFLSYHIFAVRKINTVAKRLTHLGLAVGTDQSGDLTNQRLGFGEDLTKFGIKFAGDFPSQLDVRFLVLANRNEIRSDHQNIRRLQNGIGQKSQ